MLINNNKLEEAALVQSREPHSSLSYCFVSFSGTTAGSNTLPCTSFPLFACSSPKRRLTFVLTRRQGIFHNHYCDTIKCNKNIVFQELLNIYRPFAL